MYKRIVLNEPHASMEGLYDADKSYWQIDADFLNNVVIKWTDWHTDYLFHGVSDSRITTIRFPYSRFIVDAERLWNDPMENIGQGIVYKEFDSYRRTVPSESEQNLLQLWQWHQQRLTTALRENALLLDCHSFPEELSDVDICIGYNEDWSKPSKETIELAVNHFMDKGYKVGVNYPYSNSETPDCNFHYHSLMLEVNKKTYLKSGTIHLQDRHRKRWKIGDWTDDTDMMLCIANAAVACAILGAKYGYDAIPNEYKEGLFYRDQLDSVIAGLESIVEPRA